jgi:integrase/recombinase XerD
LKDPARSIVAATEYFLGYCRASNLSPNTIGYYQYRLRAFSRYLDDNAPGVGPRDVTRQMIREFVNWELQHASPSTVNHSITTLRAFFNLLAADGLILESPLTGLKKVKQPRRLIQTFSPEQVEALLATCGTNFAGVRDKAMLLLLYDCGPRASELTGLRLEDVNWSERTINLVGKGDKERIIPFGETARRALAVYLARRPELGNDFLFVSCFGEPIDRHRLLAMIKERCAAAKISGPRCSPHTLRHSFAINYLRGGGDLFSLQKILGHTDLSMTRRYAELSTTDVREKHRAHSPADRLKPAEPSKGRKRIYSW